MYVDMPELPSELRLLKLAEWYKLLLGDFSTIKKAYIKWALVLFLIFHYGFQVMLGVLNLINSSPDLSFTLPSLTRKTHLLLTPAGLTMYVIWCRDRKLLIGIAHEVNHLMTVFQIPLSEGIRSRVISELESRHRNIIVFLTASSQIAICGYMLPPLVAFLLDTSQSKVLRLPMGTPDPVDALGVTPTSVTRGLVFLLFTIAGATNFLGLWLGFANIIIIIDTLKTLFRLSGLAFRSLGEGRLTRRQHFLSAVKFHQRLFRLSSKVQTLMKHTVVVGVSVSIVYNVVCGSAIFQEFRFRNFKFLTMALTIITLIAFFFVLPANTSYMAEEVAKYVYYNRNWVAKKSEFSRYLPFIIMRANKRVNFKIFDCWTLTSENFVKYLQLLYSFCVVLWSVTSRSAKSTDNSY